MKGKTLQTLDEKRQELTHSGAFNDLEHSINIKRTKSSSIGTPIALDMRIDINTLTEVAYDLN